jgi:hypothetical protein
MRRAHDGLDMKHPRLTDDEVMQLAKLIGRTFGGYRLEDVLTVLATLMAFTLQENFDTLESRHQAFDTMRALCFRIGNQGGNDADADRTARDPARNHGRRQ